MAKKCAHRVPSASKCRQRLFLTTYKILVRIVFTSQSRNRISGGPKWPKSVPTVCPALANVVSVSPSKTGLLTLFFQWRVGPEIQNLDQCMSRRICFASSNQKRLLESHCLFVQEGQGTLMKTWGVGSEIHKVVQEQADFFRFIFAVGGISGCKNDRILSTWF